MTRRLLLGLIGLSPLAMISAKIPVKDSIIDILIKRWIKSKEYTMAVLEAMPEDELEFSPTKEQMSFAQHFMHIGFTNNSFIGILMDSNTYPDFNAMMKAKFFVESPDPISVFQPDKLKIRDAKMNKALVSKYVIDTYAYVITSLEKLNDDMLTRGEDKVKPWYLVGHTNLDLILRAETHTTHHRAQAVSYLRMKGIQPPTYSKFNTFASR